MPLYPLGTIVLVSQVEDQNGVNPKDRFVVLIQDVEANDVHVQGVAITGTFPQPIPSTCVSLPFQRQGRTRTGLTKACVANCSWVVVVAVNDIIKRVGMTPPLELSAIQREVQAFLPRPPSGAPPSPQSP